MWAAEGTVCVAEHRDCADEHILLGVATSFETRVVDQAYPAEVAALLMA